MERLGVGREGQGCAGGRGSREDPSRIPEAGSECFPPPSPQRRLWTLRLNIPRPSGFTQNQNQPPPEPSV